MKFSLTQKKGWLVVVLVFVSSFALAGERGEDNASTFQVNLLSLTGFSASESKKAYSVADLLESVIRSEAFHQAILSYTWNGSKQFADNQGLSNAEIYEKIMTGKEWFSKEANHAADYNISLVRIFCPFWKKSCTIGYTYPDSDRIFVARWFFDQSSHSSVVGNFMHEWLHKIGFDHDYNATAKRPYSVPYAIGNIAVRLASQQMGLSDKAINIAQQRGESCMRHKNGGKH